MDSQRLKKRGLDCSPLQEPSTAKRHADKASSGSSHSVPSPTMRPVVIKTEREDSVPTAESGPNSLPCRNMIDQILDSFDNDPNTIPTVGFADLFPSNSSSAASRVKPETSESIAPMAEAEPGLPILPSGLLSRLRSPGLDKNHPADVVRRSYASVAKSLREAFVSKLTSDESLDVDSVIDLANAALESLSQLVGSSSELYWAVRDLIALRHELSEAEKELKSNERLMDMVARRDALVARSSEASKALMSTVDSLDKARKAVSEKQDLIKKLREEVTEGDKEISALEKEFDRVKEVFLAATSEQQDVAKRVEEEKEIARRINARSDEAKAGIERTKALLSSMLA